jgi:glycosyltransferase involved in cell wall biosynthesis
MDFVRIGSNVDDVEKTKKPTKQDTFTITYTGTIDSQYEPEVLLRVVQRIRAEQPTLPIKMRFIGIVSPELKKEIEIIYQLNDITSFEEYVPHKQSIEYLGQGSVLLLVSPKVSSELIIIPGKLYEYLGIRKPIINIGNPNTDTARIVSLCQAGVNVDRNDDILLYNYLNQLIEDWKTNHHVDLVNDNENYQEYRRSRIVDKLQQIIG